MRTKKAFCIILAALMLMITGCGVVNNTKHEDEASTYLVDETSQEERKENSDAFTQEDSENDNLSDELKPDKNKKNLTITMLDVGQGLCLLMESDGEYAVYDGGGRDYSSYVVSYMTKHGIDKFKYMFTSHYDEDHINGLVGLMAKFDIDTVVRPDYERDTRIYESYMEHLMNSGAKNVFPEPGDTFYLGDATITVLAPDGYTSDDGNNNSVVVNVECGDFSCIITGDAEYDEEMWMLENEKCRDCDVYVVGHHGSSSSSEKKFIEAISPEYAFLSVGAGNSYGHPTEKTMDTLQACGVQIFRTDMQQEVTCRVTGDGYSFDKEPVNDYTAGVKESSDTSEHPEAEYYILNIHSKKFHLPRCEYAKSISEKNREVSKLSRDELITNGFEPCGACNP